MSDNSNSYTTFQNLCELFIALKLKDEFSESELNKKIDYIKNRIRTGAVSAVKNFEIEIFNLVY